MPRCQPSSGHQQSSTLPTSAAPKPSCAASTVYPVDGIQGWQRREAPNSTPPMEARARLVFDARGGGARRGSTPPHASAKSDLIGVGARRRRTTAVDRARAWVGRSPARRLLWRPSSLSICRAAHMCRQSWLRRTEALRRA